MINAAPHLAEQHFCIIYENCYKPYNCILLSTLYTLYEIRPEILHIFHFYTSKIVTVHSVLSNTLRDAGNMNLLVQCPRSIVCFANLIYANRINSRGMSRVFCDLRSQKTPRGILPVNSNLLIAFRNLRRGLT